MAPREGSGGRIPGEGRHGTVGQQVGEEAGEVDTRFEAVGQWGTHRHGPPTVVHLRQRCSPVLGRWSGCRHRWQGR
jgi:hypothetical protein